MSLISIIDCSVVMSLDLKITHTDEQGIALSNLKKQKTKKQKNKTKTKTGGVLI